MARGNTRIISASQKDLAKLFGSLCDRHSSWQVWADFIETTAISIQNVFEQVNPSKRAAERERRYREIMAQYTHAEQNVFPQMLVTMSEAMEENQDQDFLGEMFMALELGSHWKGQFFTPYNICRCMAEMQLYDAGDRIKERGWVGVNDPACGAGALLIAARNVFARNGIGSDRVLFVAQDIDRVAGLMCYIQLSLLGCAGYVVIADTLCNPILGGDPLFPVFNEDHDPWFTPMWYLDVWSGRRFWYAAGMKVGATFADAAETQRIEPPAAETQRPEPEEVKPSPPPVPDVAVGEQLRLF